MKIQRLHFFTQKTHMTLLEAIDCRVSRRSYLDKPIEKSKIDVLQKLIDKLNHEFSVSFLFVEDGFELFKTIKKSYGMFCGVRSLLVVKGEKNDPFLYEKLGYCGELLVLEATTIGLGSCWIGGDYNQKKESLNATEDEHIVCLISLGYAAEKLSLKESLIRKVAHGKTKLLTHFYTSDTIPPQWFIDGIVAVSKAPSAINRQKYVFEFSNNHIKTRTTDNGKYDQLDLGIAKAHFELATKGFFHWKDEWFR